MLMTHSRLLTAQIHSRLQSPALQIAEQTSFQYHYRCAANLHRRNGLAWAADAYLYRASPAHIMALLG